MGKYRKVDPMIWNDRKFMELSDEGKLVFFFLLTHPSMTSLGAMRGTVPGLAAEIGWDEKAFREAFREGLSKGMVLHNEKASFFLLPNFMKYNRPESPNVVKAWVSSVDMLPECDLLVHAISKACECAEGLGKAFAEALPKDFAKAMPNPEQEQEQDLKESCVELPAESPAQDHGPILLTFPLSRKGDEFHVYQNDVDQWQESFPGVDVNQELKACRQWNIDNPAKRKTKSGIRGHISRWIGKAQNRGGGHRPTTQQKRESYGGYEF